MAGGPTDPEGRAQNKTVDGPNGDDFRPRLCSSLAVDVFRLTDASYGAKTAIAVDKIPAIREVREIIEDVAAAAAVGLFATTRRRDGSLLSGEAPVQADFVASVHRKWRFNVKTP